MIAVVDYGMGNLRSVMNALERLELPAELVDSPTRLWEFERLIIPGVGAFGDGMQELHARGLTGAIRDLAREGRPVLGICLGMQLLADQGSEYGEHEGLGLIPGSVDRIERADLRIPHVGWNTLTPRTESVLFEGIDPDPTFYYVHSFEFRPSDPGAVVGVTEYGGPVTACVQLDNVYGVQFHPEKSQRDGLQLLRGFATA